MGQRLSGDGNKATTINATLPRRVNHRAAAGSRWSSGGAVRVLYSGILLDPHSLNMRRGLSECFLVVLNVLRHHS